MWGLARLLSLGGRAATAAPSWATAVSRGVARPARLLVEVEAPRSTQRTRAGGAVQAAQQQLRRLCDANDVAQPVRGGRRYVKPSARRVARKEHAVYMMEKRSRYRMLQLVLARRAQGA